MLKAYKKLKVLDSPSEDTYLYLVQKIANNEQYYMYELAEGDPYQDYFKFLKRISGSPHILTYEEQISKDSTMYYIIQKPEPSLLKHQSLLESHMFQLQQAMGIFSQILQGLLELTKLGYLYLNTKPDCIKLHDGSAKLCNFSNVMRISKAEKLEKTLQGVVDDRFMPPEGLLKKGVGIKSQFWMLGVTFYFMLNAEYPFMGEDIQEVISKKCQGGFNYKAQVEQSKNKNVKTATQQVCDFFNKVFVIDPQKRISERQMKTFAQVSKYFSEQTLSFIREQRVQQSIIRSHINDRFFFNYLNLQLQILNFLQINAAHIYTQNIQLLEEAPRMAVRYALLKLSLVKLAELALLMDSKEAAPYRIQNDYVLLKESFAKIKKIIDMQYKQVCLEMQSQGTAVEQAKKILGELYGEPIPDSFSVIKKPFRALTSRLFSSETTKYKKSRSDPVMSRKRLQLLVRIVFFHLINRMFEQQQREDNLKMYIKWNNSKEISGLNAWIKEDTDERLTNFIKYISEKYL